jgi:CRISPR/Cas system-associated protein endoribonuclease Cas2
MIKMCVKSNCDQKIHNHEIRMVIIYDLEIYSPSKQAEFKTHKTFLLLNQSTLLNVYVYARLREYSGIWNKPTTCILSSMFRRQNKLDLEK